MAGWSRPPGKRPERSARKRTRLQRSMWLLWAVLPHIEEAEAGEARLFKGGVDAAEDSLDGDTGVLPAFDEGPVERGHEEEGRAAGALEVLFDLGEIIEVVQEQVSILGGRCARLKTSLVVPLPDHL